MLTTVFSSSDSLSGHQPVQLLPRLQFHCSQDYRGENSRISASKYLTKPDRQNLIAHLIRTHFSGSPNSYLLEYFKVFGHSQNISQCSSSIFSNSFPLNFIPFKPGTENIPEMVILVQIVNTPFQKHLL